MHILFIGSITVESNSAGQIFKYGIINTPKQWCVPMMLMLKPCVIEVSSVVIFYMTNSLLSQ